MKVVCLRPDELSESQVMAWNGFRTGIYEHPFFAPEYTRLIAEARSDVRVAIAEPDAPTAFLPFQSGERPGNAVPVGGRLTDYQGPICQRGGWDTRPVLQACGLKSYRFDHLPMGESSPAFPHFSTATSPYLNLSEGFPAYCQRLRDKGSSAIPQLARKARKLEREVGPIRFEWQTDDRKVFDQLITWKTDYIRRRAAYPLFQQRWVMESVERVWQTAGPNCTGRLCALYAGDELAAVHLGLFSQHTAHWWITSYDEQYAKYSPGVLMLLRLAEAAAEQGIQRLDLGKGQEAYKQRLQSDSVLLAEGLISTHRGLQCWGRLKHFCRDRIRHSQLEPWLQKSKQLLRYGSSP